MPDLQQPRPDPLWRCVDRDGSRGVERWVGNESVTRHPPSNLDVGRSPSKLPGPNKHQIQGHEQDRDGTAAKNNPLQLWSLEFHPVQIAGLALGPRHEALGEGILTFMRVGPP